MDPISDGNSNLSSGTEFPTQVEIANGDATKTLSLDAVTLRVEGETLLIDGVPTKRPSVFASCFGRADNATTSIPLHDILWIEKTNDAIEIDYVVKGSKSRLQPRKDRFPVTGEASTLKTLDTWISSVLAKAYGRSTPRKRAYVLVNPFSGTKKARSQWQGSIKQIFQAARWDLTVVHTESSGHAIELVRDLDINSYDVVMACSGDGVVHEIFNGLAKRADARRAFAQLPIAHVPCGTGNSLSKALYGVREPTIAALEIIKGIGIPFDVASITQRGDDGGVVRTVSFDGLAFGLVGEIEPSTEHLRWMGELRYRYGYVKKVLMKQAYPCDIAFKVEAHGRQEVTELYARERSLAEQPNWSGITEDSTSVNELGLPPLKWGTIEDDIPGEWERVKWDNMGMLWTGSTPWPDSKDNLFSCALPNDGLTDMVRADCDVPLLTAISYLGDAAAGRILERPEVMYSKVSAFRFTPRAPKGWITVDGEGKNYPFRATQVEIHRGLARVITKNKIYFGAAPAGWEKFRAPKDQTTAAT